jgi:hypothetical protein
MEWSQTFVKGLRLEYGYVPMRGGTAAHKEMTRHQYKCRNQEMSGFYCDTPKCPSGETWRDENRYVLDEVKEGSYTRYKLRQLTKDAWREELARREREILAGATANPTDRTKTGQQEPSPAVRLALSTLSRATSGDQRAQTDGQGQAASTDAMVGAGEEAQGTAQRPERVREGSEGQREEQTRPSTGVQEPTPGSLPEDVQALLREILSGRGSRVPKGVAEKPAKKVRGRPRKYATDREANRARKQRQRSRKRRVSR